MLYGIRSHVYCCTVRRLLCDCCRRLLSSSSLLPAQTHYEVLGVSRKASKEEIKAAFVSLSKKFHPDLNPALRNAQKLTVEVNKAYGVLGSQTRRDMYDLQLQTIENYRAEFASRQRPHNPNYSQYAGSGWREPNASPFNNGSSSGPAGAAYSSGGFASARDFETFSEADWEQVRRKNAQNRRKSHFRVIRYLVCLMVVGSVVHALRIWWAHRQFSERSEAASKRRTAAYEEVRERARTSSVSEQLERLSKRHSESLESVRVANGSRRKR